MKYGNVFTQIIMFSLKKVDELRVREREREEKGTTNSAPWFLFPPKYGGRHSPCYITGLRRPCVVDAELPQCGATSIKREEFGESIGLRNS